MGVSGTQVLELHPLSCHFHTAGPSIHLGRLFRHITSGLLEALAMNGLPPRNDRTLEEFASLEYILLGDLRDLLEEAPSEQTSRWLLAVLDALLEALPQELALKSEEGFLEEVLCDHPHWEPQVERLRSEYVRLCVWLEELRDRLLSRSPFEEIASRLRYELREWMTALQAYHRHETRLLQTSVNLEVGGGD